MARGDITIVLVINATSGVYTTRQPSSGVVEMCTDAGTLYGGSAPNQLPQITLKRIDGTNNESELEDVNGPIVFFLAKHMFDNTNYLSMAQVLGSSADFTFCMVEVES